MVEVGIASEGETLSDLEFLFSDDETPPMIEETTSKGKAIATLVFLTTVNVCDFIY